MTNNLRSEEEKAGAGCTTDGHCLLQSKEPTQEFPAEKPEHHNCTPNRVMLPAGSRPSRWQPEDPSVNTPDLMLI